MTFVNTNLQSVRLQNFVMVLLQRHRSDHLEITKVQVHTLRAGDRVCQEHGGRETTRRQHRPIPLSSTSQPPLTPCARCLSVRIRPTWLQDHSRLSGGRRLSAVRPCMNLPLPYLTRAYFLWFSPLNFSWLGFNAVKWHQHSLLASSFLHGQELHCYDWTIRRQLPGKSCCEANCKANCTHFTP